MGDYAKSIYVYERMVALSPNNENYLQNLSESYLMTGQYKKALELSERLIKLRPEISDYMERYERIKQAEAGSKMKS